MLVLNARVPVIEQLAFGHDGQRLYAAGMWYGNRQFLRANHGIDVWHFSGQSNPDGQLVPDQVVQGFVVNPAGKWLYANAVRYIRAEGAIDSDYFAIDSATGQPTRLGLTPFSRQLAISTSGDWFVGCGCVGDWSHTRIIRWRQRASGSPEREWEWTPSSHSERPWQILYDSARSRILTVEGDYDRERGLLGFLVSRDPSSWGIKEQFPLVGKSVGSLSISPDGS